MLKLPSASKPSRTTTSAWRQCAYLLLVYTISFIGAHADATWNSPFNGNWSSTSWVPSGPPGSTTTTFNADVATFPSFPINGESPYTVTIDKVSQNIGGLTFTTNLANIGINNGNPLFLSSGGTITAQTGVASPCNVQAPLIIEPALGGPNGSYTFTATPSSKLLCATSVSGASGANNLTLNLNSTGGTIILTNVANGGATNLGVTVAGSGTNNIAELQGTCAYTGPTTAISGELWIQGPITTSSNLVVAGGTVLFGQSGTPSTLSVNGLNVNFALSNVSVTAGDTLNLGPITRSPGGFIDFNGLGGSSGTAVTTSTGLIGPWAVYGTGSTMAYAQSNGSSGISAYTGATIATSGSMANMTSSTTEYVYPSASSTNVTLVGNATGDTLQVVPSNVKIALAGNNLTLNGLLYSTLMSVGGLGNVQIGPNNELDLISSSSGGSLAITAPVTGAGSIVMANGTVTLSGNNTYSVGTVVVSGTLNLNASGTTGSNSAIGPGPLTLGTGASIGNTSGTTVSLATNNTQTWNGSFNFTGNGSLSMGTGSITLGASSVTINNNASGSFLLTEGGAINGTGNLILGGGSGGLAFTGNVNNVGSITNAGTSTGSTTISGAIGANATGVVENSTTSNLILTGTNTYICGTTITSGTLQVGNGGTTGNLGSGGIVDNGSLIYDLSSNLTENNTISGSGGVTQNGASTLTLAQAETYTGPTQINSGTLALASGSNLASSSVVELTGGFDISNAGNQSVQALVGNGNVSLGGNTLTIATVGNGSSTDSCGAVSGSGGSLVIGKSTGGSSTLTLNGNSTYTGGTTINPTGTLIVMGSIAGNVVDNGVLEFNSQTDYTFNGSITGNGQVVQESQNELLLTGNNVGVNSISVTGGTLALNSSSAGGPDTTAITLNGGNFATSATFSNPHPIILKANATYSTGLGTTTTQVGPISGAFTLTAAGSGTLNLSGTNTYAGLTVSGGIVQVVGSGVVAGSVDRVTLNTGGTLDLGGTTQTIGQLFMNGGVLQNGTLISGQIFIERAYTLSTGINLQGGSISISSGAPITVVVTGTDTNAGEITISGGSTLQVGNGGTAGSIGGELNGSGSSQLVFDRSDTITSNNYITGSISLTQEGAGTLILTGPNDYFGTTSIKSGAIEVEGGGSLGQSATTVSNGAALQLDGSVSPVSFTNSVTVNGVGGSGNGAIENIAGVNTINGAITLNSASTVGADAGSTLILSGGPVSGAYPLTLTGAGNGVLGMNVSSSVTSLTKSGGGTWTMTGSNTYSGGTTITGGTLLASNSSGSATGSGTVTVNIGGTMGGIGSVKAVSLLAGSNLLAGTTTNIGTLTASSLTWNGTAQFEALLSNSSNSSSMLNLGTGSLTKGTGSSFAFNFLGTGELGQTYTLVTFGASNTTFHTSDFSATNLPAGVIGVFSFSTSGATESLQVTLQQAPAITNAPLTTTTVVNNTFGFTYTFTGFPTPTFSILSGNLPNGLTLSTAGAISGTPTLPGTFTGSVDATNGVNPDATQSFIITVTDIYSAWATRNGLSGPSAAMTAVTAHDGLNNLFKYALGLTPTTNYNPGDSHLPLVSAGSNYLTLTFNGVATDVTYKVQATSNLTAGWTTIQTYSSGGTAPGIQTVQDSQPMSASSQRYMRLIMTSP